MKQAKETINWKGLEKLPQELTACPQWRLWKYENQGGEKKKVPCNASGVRQKPSNGLAAFKTVCETARNKGLGIGFYLRQNDSKPGEAWKEREKGPGLACLDFDHTGDDTEAIAAAIYQQLGEDTYTEYSPSGNGIHIWFKVDHLEMLQGTRPVFLLQGKAIHGELYGYSRFVTVTGHIYKAASLCNGTNGDHLLQWLYEQTKAWDTHKGAGASCYDLPPSVSKLVDDEAIQEALETVIPDLEAPGLADLTIIDELNRYLGAKSFADNTQSAIDMAAMDFLSVETNGDPAAMLKLFYQADPENARAKWTDPKHFKHYAIPTMHKAIGLYYLQTGKGITEEYIAGLSREDLTGKDLVQRIQGIKDKELREYVRQRAEERAIQLRCKGEFQKLYQDEKKRREQAAREGRVTRFPGQPKALLCGEYFCDEQGVRRIRETNGVERPEVVSPVPIMPTAIYENLEDHSEMVALAQYKAGKWSTITVPRSVLANKNKIINLAGLGIEVTTTTAAAMVNYLARIINLNVDNGRDPEHTLERKASISHFGWAAGNEFVPYSDKIHLDIGEQERQLVGAVQPKGELKTWLSIVAPHLPTLAIRLAIAASLASPIVGYLKELPFVFHLWGPTGVGKSVALKVAASVWGFPDEGGGLVNSMNNTINHFMGKAAILHSIPFLGDELQTIKSRYKWENYDTLIYCLTEGISRGRMKADGSMEPQHHWRNVFLFTGEETVTQSSSGGGAENRAVEMEIPSPIMDSLRVGPLLDKINTCYGVLSPVFVQQLKGRKEELKTHIGAYHAALMAKPYGATPKQARSLAIMAAAYSLFREIAKQAGVDVPELALDDLKPILKTAENVDTAERAFQYAKDRIMMNANNFIGWPLGNEQPFHTPRNECWGKLMNHVKPGEQGQVYEVGIYKAALERILAERGFRLKAVQGEWAKRGYLEKRYGRYSAADSVNGLKGSMYKLTIQE